MLLAQILSSITVMICMLIDSIMIGRFLGVNAMTAYGLAAPLILVFAAVGSILSAGVQVMCGKAMGSGDRKAANSCYSTSVFIGLLISLAGLALVLIFAPRFATLLGAGKPSPDNEVFRLTKGYLRGFIIGAPAVIIAQIAVPFMQMSGNRWRLALAVSVLTVSDIVLDSLNVFVFKKGTFGMGIASGLSYYLALSVGIGYFISKKCIFRFRPGLIRLRTAGRLLKYGTPTIINQLSFVLLIFTINNILLDVGGNRAVAAYSVIYSIGNICYSVGTGIGAIALMLSSIFYADEDITSLKILIRVISIYSFVLNTILTVLILLFAPIFVSLFLPDAGKVRKLAIFGLRVFSASLLASSINTSLKNYYQGINRFKFTETISFLQNFVFTSLYAFILSRFLGVTGVWVSFVFGESTTLLFLAVSVCVYNRKPTLSEEAFLMLPKDFGVSPENCLELTASDLPGAEGLAIKALKFCSERGVDGEITGAITKCISEMVGNTVKHGFGADNKAHSIDLRIMLRKDGKKVVRLRDNCVNFDPVRYFELHGSENDQSGINKVMSLVSDASYMNSLGLNNLTLVF